MLSVSLSAAPSTRAVCPRCLRAQNACICRWITPVAHATEVLILQHPLEVRHAKNSARLLHLSLPHSRLVVGESFADAAWLTAPWREDAAPRHAVLLYPDTPHDQADDLTPPPVLPQAWLLDPARLRLVVLDATWRKSRKMLYRSPALQQLPRLALHGTPPSRYHIRQAHRPDQLSTLEAGCAALAQLEGGAARFEPLLVGFDGFVAQQWALRAGPPPPATDNTRPAT